MRLRSWLVLALAAVAFTPAAPAQDRVLMQGFYWDVEPGGVWYDRLTAAAPRLGWAGFDALWLPPLSKGAACQSDVGYTPYDYYDLGAYDSCGGDTTQGQGGFIPTLYGTASGLRGAVDALHANGLDVYADIVLNHRSGGSLEDNAYGGYYSWGGGSLYSENGRTYTAFPLTHGSGRLAWSDGDEFFFPNASNNPGNTGDFFGESQLAGFHRLYTNTFAYDNALHNGFGQNLPLGDSLMAWGDWLTRELSLDGFRFDFVKGIHPEYLKRWVDHGAMRGLFHVHELYDGDVGRLRTYLGQLAGSERPPAVFDFSLRFAYEAVLDGGEPVYRWQEAGLLNQPGVPFDQIVTFVDNHDFDRINHSGQVALPDHNPVVNHKMLAYAHMLTHPGTASVWWRDYFDYGLGGEIDELVRIRKAFASGAYYALTNGAIGAPYWPQAASNPWNNLYVGQRTGDGPGRGLIVAINTHPTEWREVWVTQQNGAWTGQTLKDLTGHAGGGTTTIQGDGRVRVWAPPLSYTVWVPESYTLAQAPPMPAPGTPAYHQIDFANLQWPATATVEAGGSTTFYARAYVHGRTNAPGAGDGVQAWIGTGAPGTDPATWTDWVEAPFHADQGHLDEFAATLAPAPGTYAVASRVQYAGQPFVYGGFSATGGGAWDQDRFPSATLTVNGWPTYTLSGTVRRAGAPLAGVTVSAVGPDATPRAAVTDALGAFAFPDLPEGTYTVVPSLAGYAFAPASREVALAADATADFDATRLPVQVGPITASTPDPVAIGTALTFTAPVVDLGGAALASATWQWGDGSPATPATVAGGRLSGTHAYGAPGVYTVRLTLVNAAGGEGAAIYQYAVAYDPDGGFVTGGGWIASPAGAFPSSPDLTGRAQFGFSARYRRGQTVPGGDTQFQFEAAGLSFVSSSLEWLVVAGPSARYKGRGAINGAGDYGFLLAARDGGSGGADDRFRIKIWDRATGAVVYDNQIGAADDAEATTALGGGNVTVHTGGRAGGTRKGEGIPETYVLDPPAPNPFRSAATVRFGLPEGGPVAVVVYDALGREVSRLAEATLEAGWHALTFDGRDLPAGVYVVQVQAGAERLTQRLTLVR